MSPLFQSKLKWIVEKVSEEHGVDQSLLLTKRVGARRTGGQFPLRIAHARFQVWYLMRLLPPTSTGFFYSYPRLAKLYGLDHTSIIHGVKWWGKHCGNTVPEWFCERISEELSVLMRVLNFDELMAMRRHWAALTDGIGMIVFNRAVDKVGRRTFDTLKEGGGDVKSITAADLVNHLRRGGLVYDVGDGLCTDDNRLVPPSVWKEVCQEAEPKSYDLFGDRPLSFGARGV